MLKDVPSLTPFLFFSVTLGKVWYYKNVGMVLQQLELLTKEIT